MRRGRSASQSGDPALITYHFVFVQPTNVGLPLPLLRGRAGVEALADDEGDAEVAAEDGQGVIHPLHDPDEVVAFELLLHEERFLDEAVRERIAMEDQLASRFEEVIDERLLVELQQRRSLGITAAVLDARQVETGPRIVHPPVRVKVARVKAIDGMAKEGEQKIAGALVNLLLAEEAER